MASIEPQKGLPKAKFRQPRYSHLPATISRGLIVAGSAGGKTTLVASMILDLYRGCFDEIHYWSQSADLDPAYSAIEKYARNELGQEGYILHNTWDEGYIAELMKRQQKVVSAARRSNDGKQYLPQSLWVVDDYADDPKVARGKTLTSLCTRGRHLHINCWILSQRNRMVGPSIRCNLSFIICFKLKNSLDLFSVLEEQSALVDEKTLRQLYDTATERPYGFLYIDLTASNLSETFYRNFEARLVVR